MNEPTETALITGGTDGIGLECVELFLEQGFAVISVGLQGTQSQRLQDLQKKFSLQLSLVYQDLSRPGSVQELLKTIQPHCQSLQVIVNNAGGAKYKSFLDQQITEIESVMQLNVISAMTLTRALLPQLLGSKKKTSIINVSSIAGEIAIMPNMIYMCAKQAMNAWTKSLYIELQNTNVTVSNICPGRVDTRFFDDESYQIHSNRSGKENPLTARTVAKAIFALVEKPQRTVYIPYRYALISWIYRAVPGFRKFIFEPILRKRMREYHERNGHESVSSLR